jgi:hypothetical protein
MKTQKYYFLLTAAIAILCAGAGGKAQLPPHEEQPMPLLLGLANPALAEIDKLYVVIEPADAKPSKDGLIWKELEANVKTKIQEAGIRIAAGVDLGKGRKAHDIPELRIQMEMLKFADLELYAFRVQTSLATEAYLKAQDLSFKADVWKSPASMQAVSITDMPDTVTNTILAQVQTFIHGWLAANPQGLQPEKAADNTDRSAITPKKLARAVAESAAARSPVDKPAVAEQKYVASRNSNVFHKPTCSAAKRIKPKNLVSYGSRTEAIRVGKRPCKLCNP